jgi:hypothetical protein
MSRIVNRNNAPASLVAFAQAKHYDAAGSTYTVTQLIDSPRLRILRSRYHDRIEEDAYDVVFRLIGTSIHHIAEQFSGGGEAEERVFLRMEVGGKKITVSGAMDLQTREDGGIVIGDYKFTSVGAAKYPEKYERQLNLYAHIIKTVKNTPVSRLEVYAILKDWNWRRAQTDSEYPQSPGITIPVRLWSDEEQLEFFTDRVAVHVAADDGLSHDDGHGEGLVKCTEDEQWRSPSKWAVMSKKRDQRAKTGRGRAVSVVDTKPEAEALLTEEDRYLEFRPGEAIRCVAFCPVSEWCEQRKQEEGNDAEQ